MVLSRQHNQIPLLHGGSYALRSARLLPPCAAMLKIVSLGNGCETVRLVLEGQLIGRWVDELRRICDEVLDSGRGLTLDLGAVTFIDRAGAELVRGIAARHVEITNRSLFVTEQLKAAER